MTAIPRPVPAGEEAEVEWVMRNDRASVVAAQARLTEWLAGQPIPPRARHRLELLFEELALNVVMHAHPGEAPGGHEFTVRIGVAPDAARLVIEDGGIPFDPRSAVGQKLSGPLEEVRIGGLGLLLVKEMSSGIEYARTPEGRNRTTVTVALA